MCEAPQSGSICYSSRRKRGSQRAWSGNDAREGMTGRREWGAEVGPGGTRSPLVCRLNSRHGRTLPRVGPSAHCLGVYTDHVPT